MSPAPYAPKVKTMNVLSCDFDAEGPLCLEEVSAFIFFHHRDSLLGRIIKGDLSERLTGLSRVYFTKRRWGLITQLNSVRCFPQNKNFVMVLRVK